MAVSTKIIAETAKTKNVKYPFERTLILSNGLSLFIMILLLKQPKLEQFQSVICCCPIRARECTRPRATRCQQRRSAWQESACLRSGSPCDCGQLLSADRHDRHLSVREFRELPLQSVIQLLQLAEVVEKSESQRVTSCARNAGINSQP